MNNKVIRYSKIAFFTMFLCLTMIGMCLRNNEAVLPINIIQVLLVVGILFQRKYNLIDTLFGLFFMILSFAIVILFGKMLVQYPNGDWTESNITIIFDSIKWMFIVSGIIFWTAVITLILEIIFRNKIKINFLKVSLNNFKLIILHLVAYLILTTVIIIEFLAPALNQWRDAWIVSIFFATLISSIPTLLIVNKFEMKFI